MIYMSLIALIPARKNSKRIPNKNIKIINGKPLIKIAIENIKKANIFDRIYISSDCKKIIRAAKTSGAISPFVRPKKISGDYTPVSDVVHHFALWAKKKNIKVDTICLVYPTSIFLNPRILKSSYNLFKNKKCNFLLPVKKFPQIGRAHV